LYASRALDFAERDAIAVRLRRWAAKSMSRAPASARRFIVQHASAADAHTAIVA
jgi:hypothetical protein